MRIGKIPRQTWLAVGLFSLGIAFLVDVLFPLGAVAGLLYVIIAVSGFFVSARDAIILASAATVANVLGYCLAPTMDIPEWIVAVSRIASVFTTWLLIVSGIHFHKQSQGVIATIRESHERRQQAARRSRAIATRTDRGIATAYQCHPHADRLFGSRSALSV